MKISYLQNIDINTVNTLIFDWGGVITNIDPLKTQQAMTALGHPDFGKYFEPGLKNNMFFGLETGELAPELIYSTLNKEIGKEYPAHRLNQALCAMMLDTPPVRLKILKKLSRAYKIYLLSNTNIIHTNYYNSLLKEKYNIDYPGIFKKVFYSYEMGMRKPHPDIFLKVLEAEQLNAAEVLFFDDTEINIETARSLGMGTTLITKENSLEKIFETLL